MLKKNIRQRKEYLFKKNEEIKNKLIYEKKQRIKNAVDSNIINQTKFLIFLNKNFLLNLKFKMIKKSLLN